MKTLLAFLIGLISIIFFYFIFYRSYVLAFGKKFIKINFRKKTWIIFGAIVLLGFILCIFSLSKNSFIYYWDYGGYWTYSFDYMDTLYRSPSDGIALLWESILNSDYNLILPLIISLPLKIFGITFSRYVIINYFMFCVPAMFIAFSLFIKISKQKKLFSHLAGFLILATFIIPLKAMLMGYIDIAIMIPAVLLLSLIIDYKSTDSPKRNMAKNISIGLLLVISFLFRRYSAFFLVGLILSFFLVELAKNLKNTHKNKLLKTNIKQLLLNFSSIGVTTLGTLLIFFSPLVFRVLNDNYSEMYVGYDTDLITKIQSVFNYSGWVFIALSSFGFIYSHYKKINRKITTVSILSILFTCILFFRVQRMDPHHFYTILAPIMLLSYLGLYYLLNLKKWILSIPVVIVILLNPIYFFSTTAQNTLSPIAPLFSAHHEPLVRNDINSLKSLEEYLKNDTTGSIFVLASGSILNADIVRSLDKPYKKIAIDRQLTTNDVDLRDGFHSDFLRADLIITTDPIQTHLANNSQEIIRYLAEQIQDPNSYIGKHFEKASATFALDSNTTVYIYHKTSEFSHQDLEQISDYYMELYPTHPELFKERILQSN